MSKPRLRQRNRVSPFGQISGNPLQKRDNPGFSFGYDRTPTDAALAATRRAQPDMRGVQRGRECSRLGTARTAL